MQKNKGYISILLAGIVGLIMLASVGVAVQKDSGNVGGTQSLLPKSMTYPGSGIPLSTGSAWGTSITNNSANWNTAYGWGNHASAGYQSALVSGSNIKTVNSTSLLGSGDIVIPAGATGPTGATGPAGADGPNNITTSTTTNGTGFLKGNGSVISFDNSTFLTDAPSNGSTYGRKDGAWATITAGAGDVIGPATNTDGYIPLWSGANSKTLADGIANNSSNWNTAYGWGNHASAGYLTSLSGAVLTSQTSGQTIGDTTNRLTKLWATDITVTNAITGSVTGSAGSISGLTLTTNLTNNGGAGTLTWPVAGATLTIPSGGGTLGTAAFTATGDYATSAQGTLATNAMPKGGGTFTGNVLFTDNTLDIGASGATRPRTGYFGTSLVAPTILPTSIELGHATDTTLARVSAGVVSIEGVTIDTISGANTLTNKTIGAGQLSLAENASVEVDPALSADGKYNGITITGTAGTALAFGDLVYLDPTDSRWELADANIAAGADGDPRGILGMVVLAAAGDGSATRILLNGVIRADTAFPALTLNAPVYVSETAGDIVVTQPTTADVVIRVVGFAIPDDGTSQSIYFNPSNDYMTHI